MNTEILDSKQLYTVWGLPGTIIWGVIIAVLFVVTQTFVIGVYVAINYGDVSVSEFEKIMTGLQYDGLVLSLCTFASLLVCGPSILGVVKLKKNSNIKHYLGLRLVTLGELKYWLVVLFGLIIIIDILTFVIGKPFISVFMESIYKSTESTWVLMLALVIAAPLFEELFFRGFLISGLSTSSLGPIGAIVISAALWTAIHVQYDLYYLITIFFIGLVFGMARIKTGSTLLTIALHSFVNLVATIETMIFVPK